MCGTQRRAAEHAPDWLGVAGDGGGGPALDFAGAMAFGPTPIVR